MPWRELTRCSDPSIPKLDNLHRATRAGLEVPGPILWDQASILERDGADSGVLARVGLPIIVRSGSPTEDTETTSNAGQFLSIVVREPEAFARDVARVVEALPVRDGRRLGAVFVQPLIEGPAGVTFFDGFYFEETRADQGNHDLTAGRSRGTVVRGHLRRDEPRSDWLQAVHRTFGGTLDLEWAEPEPGRRLLLQARPVLFPVQRNETLSLANHKEILGDPPCPWIVGVLAEVGRTVMRYYEALDPEITSWHEPYAIELGERAWLNFSAFFRLMDHWGLPRTMVTEGIGGETSSPSDALLIQSRFWRKLPTMIRTGFASYATVARMRGEFRLLDDALDRCDNLLALYDVNVRALDLSIRTNFAIMMILSVSTRLRRPLGMNQAARVVTHAMMERYAELSSRPNLADRLDGLDAWLALYGHRGPLESDPSRPRFAELRDALRADLARGPAAPPGPRPQPSRLRAAVSRVFFLSDEWREWFRDRMMRWWQRLRTRILEQALLAHEAGHLASPDDVFFLRRDDLQSDPASWKERVVSRRARWERARFLDLPTTASKDAIREAIERDATAPPDGGQRFAGIGLGSSAPIAGTAVRASELVDVLGRTALPETPVLIAPTLEPSWAVVFARFAAVVTDLGGELSHAAILLREAGIPAVVNARGVFAAVADGTPIRVDPTRGEVCLGADPAPGSVMAPPAPQPAPSPGWAFS